MNTFRSALTFFLLLSAVSAFGNQLAPESQAGQHPLVHNGLLTNPYEGLIIGNGDVAVSAQTYSHQLILHIGKNDVWDSRSEDVMTDNIMTQDDLIASNGKTDGLFSFNRAHSANYTGGSKPGPTPKPVGQIKVYHPGLSHNSKVSSKVDIATGMLTVEYGFAEGTLIIETFVHKEKNVIISKYTAKGTIPWFTITVEKRPDYVDVEIPDPILANHGNRQRSISQTIKAKHGVPDFTWHLGFYCPGDWVINWRYAIEQRLTLEDNESIVMAVGIATDRDGEGNSLERALNLSRVTGSDWYDREKQSHVNGWQSFWAASSIKLEDKELEALWYRTLFGFACHLNPGAQSPGTNANIPIFDYSAWNGDYHWNHNVQKWYFPALHVNHLEWYETFARLVKQNIPVFELFAKNVFGLEGYYVDLYTHPFIPPERAKSYATFGRAMMHTGWVSQMLFRHYEYTNDLEWLRENAYTYLAGAADFYANYMDKYQGKDLVLYPSMLLEDTDQWKEGFLENKNVLTDLIMYKKAFECAIRASELLNVDKVKRDRWKQKLKKVPPVEYGWQDGQGWFAIYKDWRQVWPNFEEYLYHIRTSRWGCSGWLVFPGEYIDGDEQSGLALAVRDVLAGTDLTGLPNKTRELGSFHGEANFLPFIRMGITEKFDDLRTLLMSHRFSSGQFSPFSNGENVYIRSALVHPWRIVENQYFPILGIAEMLLQSQGNVIRLFPFWPTGQSASFDGFRAQNGFIVSASYDPQTGVSAKIKSLNGNPCTVRWERNEMPVIKQDGKTIAFTRKGRDIIFNTTAATEYELSTK